MTINSPASRRQGPAPPAPRRSARSFDATGVTGDVVVGTDAATPPTAGHDRRLHGAHQRGRRRRQVRVVDRGTCAFAVKVKNAQDAGAIGVVVGDNVDGDADLGMSGDDADDLRSRSVTHRLSDRDSIAIALGRRPGQRHDQGRRRRPRATPTAGSSARSPPPSAARSATCGRPPATATRARSRTRSTTAHRRRRRRAQQLGCAEPRLRAAVDGGTLQRRQTVTGIGLTKAASIYCRAMTEYQTPTTDFADHADALEASLPRPRRPAAQRAEHRRRTTPPSRRSRSRRPTAPPFDAVAAAVELRKEPAQCNFKPMLDQNAPSLCGPGTRTRTSCSSEDFEDGLAGLGPGPARSSSRAASGYAVGRRRHAPGRSCGHRWPSVRPPTRAPARRRGVDFSSRDSIISPIDRAPDGQAGRPRSCRSTTTWRPRPASTAAT